MTVAGSSPPQWAISGVSATAIGRRRWRVRICSSVAHDCRSGVLGRAVDPDLGMWLGLQVGPTETNATPAMYNSQRFPVTHNYNWVKALKSVAIGNDANGVPVVDEPKPWVAGTKPGVAGQHAQAVTYTPTGCGKVLYSTFQTSNTGHAGMYPQERVLLYLIMEIQQCSEVIVE